MPEVIEKKRKINHGHNVKIARWDWKRKTQDELADLLKVHQCDISELDKKEVIEDDKLDQISTVLDVPVEFLKNFSLEDAINSYSLHNYATYEMTQTNSDSASGNEVVQQKIIENQENIYEPIDKITELYELRVNDAKTIGTLEEKVRQLERENGILKKK